MNSFSLKESGIQVMKRNSKYLVLPFIQGMGGFFLLFNQISLPKTMTKIEAVCFVLFVVAVILIPRLIWILISSYIINISKFIFYRLNKDEIISFCLFPFFVYQSKKTKANLFWVYDDRTCFSINKYLRDIKGYEELRQHLLIRNRILASIYCVCSLLSVISLCMVQKYIIAWIVFFGSVEHFLYQCEYKKIGSANAMAFAGLKKIDDRLMLHMLVNQSKIEELNFGKEVTNILSEEMFKQDGEYFFRYLCLSSIFSEVYSNKENNLSKYIDVIVKNIINCTPEALQSIEHMKSDLKYKNIDDDICVFYNSYREFLLYVLMYYKIKQNRNAYIGLNNYIRHMLDKVENDYVQDTAISEFILSDIFQEYKSIYRKILNFEFVPETSVFTGYEALPVWKQHRENFVETYNKMI